MKTKDQGAVPHVQDSVATLAPERVRRAVLVPVLRAVVATVQQHVVGHALVIVLRAVVVTVQQHAVVPAKRVVVGVVLGAVDVHGGAMVHATQQAMGGAPIYQEDVPVQVLVM